METTSIEQEKTNRKVGKFQRSPLYIRSSFIIGIITVLLVVVYIVTAGFLWHYGPVPAYLFCSLTLALAVAGTILGGISFREGKNIYGILGFIFNLIVVGSQLVALYVLHNTF